jgi:hypothetical protein
MSSILRRRLTLRPRLAVVRVQVVPVVYLCTTYVTCDGKETWGGGRREGDLELRKIRADLFVGEREGGTVLNEPRHIPASEKQDRLSVVAHRKKSHLTCMTRSSANSSSCKLTL